MWLIAGLHFWLMLQAQSTIIFQKVEHFENEAYTKSSYRITNRNGKNYLNWNATIVKPWDNKITLKIDIYFLPNAKSPAFPIPKVNFCALTSVSRHVPFMSDMIALVETYAKGNGLTRCPLKVGFYQLENIQVDDSAFRELMWLKPNSRYLAHIIIQDENGLKPVKFVDVKYYVLYKK